MHHPKPKLRAYQIQGRTRMAISFDSDLTSYIRRMANVRPSVPIYIRRLRYIALLIRQSTDLKLALIPLHYVWVEIKCMQYALMGFRVSFSFYFGEDFSFVQMIYGVFSDMFKHDLMSLTFFIFFF